MTQTHLRPSEWGFCLTLRCPKSVVGRAIFGYLKKALTPELTLTPELARRSVLNAWPSRENDVQVHFESDTQGTQTNLTTGKVRRVQKLQTLGRRPHLRR